MSRRIVTLATISAIAVGLLALTAASASAALATFYLDSFEATDAPSNNFCTGPNMLTGTTPPGCGDTVTAPIVFTDGTWYVVRVVGAVSAWGAWPADPCGKPEPTSEFPSPGRANTPAGDDAQFRFADPLTGSCPALPKKTSSFQVNLGNGWVHPTAILNPSKPSGIRFGAQHPYWFLFKGEGVAPQFRFVDFHPSDNSGRFKIVLFR